MKCISCGSDNPDRAKFCVECGTAMAARCKSCNAELPTGAKFCLECGAKVGTPAPAAAPPRETPKHLADKIRQSKAAVEGERKQVTVLFADVKGSMELAESLDPEAFSRIMSRFFAILTEGVERFEGFVDKFTGDGIMALFGAPIAHEDHAQRACYAALHLRDRARQYADELRMSSGINFSVRIGLNSGEVVVGSISDDLRMDYTAQGHTVGLAQRMEGIAPADGIAISQNTQKPVDGYFVTRTLGPLKVKGAREPIEVFVLEGVGNRRTRLDSSRARGLSRFVGRGDEMAALETALNQSLDEDERSSIDMMMLGYMRVFETLYYQYKSGTMEAKLFEAELKTLKWTVTNPGFLAWWPNNPISLSAEFRAFIDGLIRDAAPQAGPRT